MSPQEKYPKTPGVSGVPYDGFAQYDLKMSRLSFANRMNQKALFGPKSWSSHVA